MQSSNPFSRLWNQAKSPGGAAFLALAGLITGVGLGVYGLVAERQPSLQVATISTSRVFDVHQSIGGLEVSYQGQNLRAAKKTLWSTTISVNNPGSAGIRLTDFDARLPVTIFVANGSIVDRPVLSGAADYLLKTLTFKQEKSSLVFDPFILDPQDGVRISLLVLGEESEQPAISVTGKIAGIKSIELTSLASQNTAPSTWARITGADAWWIHVPRAVIYFFAFFFGLIGLAGLIALISSPFTYLANRREAARRKARLSTLKIVVQAGQEAAFDEICTAYEEEGASSLEQLVRIQKTLASREELADSLRATELPQEEVQAIAKRRFPSYPDDSRMFSRIRRAGLVKEQDGTTSLTAALQDLLQELSGRLDVDRARLAAQLERYWRYPDSINSGREFLPSEGTHSTN